MSSFPFRLVSLAFRLSIWLTCVVSLASGAILSSQPGSNGDLVGFEFSRSAGGDTSESATALGLLKWNVEDRELPLLSVSGDRLAPGFDRSLTFPLDRLSFPIFQSLIYDDEHDRYLLPSISAESPDVHFIDFEPTEIKNTFVSTDGTNIKLVDNDNLKTFRTSDGTKYVFVRYPDGEFRCASIKVPGGSYLSLIYAANGLMLHGVVDSSGRTISFNYTSEGIASITQTWMANSEGRSQTWMAGKASAPVVEPMKYAHAVSFTLAKALPSNAVVREYTQQMAASDKTLAEMFGGPNAVAAGNGFEPPGLAASYPLYRGDIMGDDGKQRRGHLSFAMHLYGNLDGTGESSLFVPAGFVSHSGEPSPTDAVVTFYYPHLGNLSDVTLAVFHVADFHISNEGGRVRIGNLGGPGGASTFYKHSHIEFYRGNTGLPALAVRLRLRIDPATVFATAARDDK
jgi:hypothetical protein